MKTLISRAAFLTFLFVSSFGVSFTVQAQGDVTTVILVRHAEKGYVPTDDPDLTEEGFRRSYVLADIARRNGVEKVYASEYRRTQETVAPAAEAIGTEVEVIGARKVSTLVRRIKVESRGSTVIIAGHSNTVPAIIKALGGPKLPWIDEAEYDNMYILKLNGASKPRFEALKYGEPSEL